MVLDQFTFLWSIFTALGWLLMVGCWAAMGVLGTLDKLPRSGWCCTCSCLTPNKVASITEDQEPQVVVAPYQSPPSQMVVVKPGPSQMQMVMVPMASQEGYPGPSRHQSVTYVGGQGYSAY